MLLAVTIFLFCFLFFLCRFARVGWLQYGLHKREIVWHKCVDGVWIFCTRVVTLSVEFSFAWVLRRTCIVREVHVLLTVFFYMCWKAFRLFRVCGSKRECSLRILVSLVYRFRYLSVFVWFGSSGEELRRSSRGRLISSFGGIPTVADCPKVEGSSLKSKVLSTSISGNWKKGIFYCISQTTCIFLCLSITNNFILWAWPRGVGVDRTTLKISCVIYFYRFYVFTCWSYFSYVSA